MLFNSIAATTKWLGVDFRPGIAITDVARFWGAPLSIFTSLVAHQPFIVCSIPMFADSKLVFLHFPYHRTDLEMSNLDYVRGSSAGSVVLWVDDRPNQQALADCEDPAYVFSAGPPFSILFLTISFSDLSYAFQCRVRWRQR